MDKLLIVSGAAMLYAAYKDEQGNLIKGIEKTVKQPGFTGTMVVLGLLLAYSQYSPKNSRYPAMIATIIALSYTAKYRSKTK